MSNIFDYILKHPAILLGGVIYLAFLPLLGFAPYWFPPDSGAASAAAIQGYNNNLAHLLVIGLSLVSLGTFALLERFGHLRAEASTLAESALPVARAGNKSYWLEIAVVFVVFVILYFPWFLSKYGPYIEDSYFLTALHRMHAGERPYVDFETLYGPLMLYLPYFWIKLTGYSMTSYYALIALMEAAQFVILLVVLQRYLPQFHLRLAVFLMLVIFLFNPLLGMSWNGLRRLVPVLILLLVAGRPNCKPVVVSAGLLLGLLFAYSHDFGVVCLLAILGVYGLMFIRGQGWTSLLPSLGIVALAVTVWLLITTLLLGDAFPAYIHASIYAVGRFAKEASFPFYWTVNSLATFGLLCLILVIVGRGLGRKTAVSPGAGDYLLFGGLVYALVGLKSGLNRADMWHLAPPMLALIFALVLPLPRNLFTYSVRAQRLALALLVVMTVTYLAALAPEGSYYARGLVLGLRDTLMPQSPAPATPVVTRAPTIELERSYPDLNALKLGEYLADDTRHDRPVVLYSKLWGLDKHIGIYKSAYPTDDFLLSDQSGYEVRDFLQESPDALVIMQRSAYNRLFGLSSADDYTEAMQVYGQSSTKKVLAWLSTTHYSAAAIESRAKEQRWERTVGTYVRANYDRVADFGDLIVLARPEGKALVNKSRDNLMNYDD